MKSIEAYMQEALQELSHLGLLRSLSPRVQGFDFYSNDYLSFVYDDLVNKAFSEKSKEAPKEFLAEGSTGSRLISGNTAVHEQLEMEISNFHGSEAALVFNSGYDANLGLFSSLAQRNDTVIYDELCHASIRDGIALSRARNWSFAHNDVNDLERKLIQAQGRVFVAIESVYSMDGDLAPLHQICELTDKYAASLIVDEAHATGVFGHFGEGLVSDMGLSAHVLARVHTFGKALGVHGAAVVGARTLVKYLINFSRPFIYTTALAPRTMLAVEAAYGAVKNGHDQRARLQRNISLYRQHVAGISGSEISDSRSPIQVCLVPGNRNVSRAAELLLEANFLVKPIRSPSVPAGKERLRICIHAHNSESEIQQLAELLRVNIASIANEVRA